MMEDKGSSEAGTKTKKGEYISPARKKSKREHVRELCKSDENKWLKQHPQIKDSQKRENAYLYDADIHPKQVKSYESRKIQLNNLGLGIATLDDNESNSPEVKFGRLFGSTSSKIRHRAVTALRSYFEQQCSSHGVTKLDLLKCWKGLWYCLYMADHVVVQTEVSKKISQLMWCFVGSEEEDEFAANYYLQLNEERSIDEEEGSDHDEEGIDDEQKEEQTLSVEEEKYDTDNKVRSICNKKKDENVHGDKIENNTGVSENKDNEETEMKEAESKDEDLNEPHFRGAHLVSLFYQTLFMTTTREWHNIDKYRIDKFYTLLRLMIHEMYKYMAFRYWNYGIIRLLNDVLYDFVLSQPFPNGVRLHICDIALDELVKVDNLEEILSNDMLRLTEATFLDIMEPFLSLCSSEKDKAVQERAITRIFDNFFS